jgi:hypothetical protein
MASPTETLASALAYVLCDHPPTGPDGNLMLPLTFVTQLLHGFQSASSTTPALYAPWVCTPSESEDPALSASTTVATANHLSEELEGERPACSLAADTVRAPTSTRCVHVPYVLQLATNLLVFPLRMSASEASTGSCDTVPSCTSTTRALDLLHLPSMSTVIFEESLVERRFLRAVQPALADNVAAILRIATEHGFTSPQLVLPVTRLIDLVGGYRGIQALLGLRLTVGSVPSLPPPLYILERSFHALHADTKGGKPMKHKSILTVGARAYLKHCHRGADAWWGTDVGSEHDKNQRATALLHKLLRDAIWVNVHMLPGDEWVVEIRVAEGYGARWTADGLKFRGFLEPPMPDGHVKGWRH